MCVGQSIYDRPMVAWRETRWGPSCLMKTGRPGSKDDGQAEKPEHEMALMIQFQEEYSVL